MSSWEYRIIAYEDSEFGELVFGLHEVFYDDDDVLDGWTKSPVTLQSDTKIGMADTLARATVAASKPVLWWEDDKLREEPHE